MLSPGETRALAKEDMIKLGNSIFKFLPAGELEILFYGNLGSAAHTDPMTKIYNKGYLVEAMEAEFKRAKALHTNMSLLFFDLDYFKKVNDTYGHDAGDYVLKEFASLGPRRVSFSVPRISSLATGVREFIIVLGGSNAIVASEIAEKIRSAVETHAFIYEGKRIPITTSLGVAELKHDMGVGSNPAQASGQSPLRVQILRAKPRERRAGLANSNQFAPVSDQTFSNR